MSGTIATFAPAQLTIIITQVSSGISHILGGFSEDSIVQIERVAETFTMYTGADNFSTRVYNANNSAKLTIALQQTSPSNDVLTQLWQNDRALLNSDGLFSIQVKDNKGRSNYFSDNAYVGVVPHSNFNNTMQVRDWIIHAHDMDMFLGGNSILTPEDQSTLKLLGDTVDSIWT